MKSKYVQYYVEGEDEEKLVNVLKSKMRIILPGKVQKLNIVEREITDARLRTLNSGTMVVLIFDTDTGNRTILDKNIKKLRACSFVTEVITIPQVPNLEGELVRSCSIRTISELLNSKSDAHFKRDLRRLSNLDTKLTEHHFDARRFWTAVPTGAYQHIENQASAIKLVK